MLSSHMTGVIASLGLLVITTKGMVSTITIDALSVLMSLLVSLFMVISRRHHMKLLICAGMVTRSAVTPGIWRGRLRPKTPPIEYSMAPQPEGHGILKQN